MKNEKELMVCENPSPALAVAIPAIIVPALLGIGLALMFGSAFDFEFNFDGDIKNLLRKLLKRG